MYRHAYIFQRGVWLSMLLLPLLLWGCDAVQDTPLAGWGEFCNSTEDCAAGLVCRGNVCSKNDTDGDMDLDADFRDDDPDTPDIDEEIQEQPDADTDGDADADPDEAEPEPEAIEWECGESGEQWTFCPVDTGLRCNMTDNGMLYENDENITPWSNAASNEDWALFVGNKTGPTDSQEVYGCYRPNGYLYKILEADADSKFIGRIILRENILIAQYSPGYYDFGLILGTLPDFASYALDMEGMWRLTGFNYPFVFANNHDTPLHAYNLLTDYHGEIDYIRCGSSHSPVTWADGLAFFTGYPESHHDAYSQGIWQADIANGVLTPISINGRSEGVYQPVADKNFVVYVSTNDMVRNNWTWPWGTAIYLFDRKHRREIPLTDNMDRNERSPLLDYPYVGWYFLKRETAVSGPTEVYNLETWQRWYYEKAYTDERLELQDRRLTFVNYSNDLGMYTLPEAGRIPHDYDCDDNNPCTDDLWWVSENRCHYRYNHDRCDDGSDATPFDVCIEGACTGILTGSDDAPMAQVPEGNFLWGGVPEPPDSELDDRPWEGPRREQWLDAFSIDVYEVTNLQYQRCVAAGACAAPKRNRSGRIRDYYDNPLYQDWPVLYVEWYEARNYCEWVGKRLPTEAEWSKAARGSEDNRIYPWGDDKPSSDNPKTNVMLDAFANIDVAQGGSFPGDVSPYGVYDMAGNISEWTASPWTPEGLDGEAPWGNDLMVRKGCNVNDYVHSAVDHREPVTPWTASFFVGFRCVKDM